MKNTTSEAMTAVTVYILYVNIIGGNMPSIISLMTPPPRAVMTPIKAMPKTSSPVSMATAAPDTAKAIMPAQKTKCPKKNVFHIPCPRK